MERGLNPRETAMRDAVALFLTIEDSTHGN